LTDLTQSVRTDTDTIELDEGGLTINVGWLSTLIYGSIVDVSWNTTTLVVDDDGVDCTSDVADIVVPGVT